MPFSRITTNFDINNALEFINEFQNIMVDILKIPENDRLVSLDMKKIGFYVPNSTSKKYILFEIHLFSGRTFETKKKLYKELFDLVKKYGVEGLNANVIIRDVDKENWGIRDGQPASEVDLGFVTDI